MPKIPSRVTLNDQKREAWITDLINPATPFAKLAKNVPHGYKGDKLLDLLVSKRVPVARGVWFIKVCGASDIVGSVLSLINFPKLDNLTAKSKGSPRIFYRRLYK